MPLGHTASAALLAVLAVELLLAVAAARPAAAVEGDKRDDAALFFVQAGAFRSQANAASRCAELARKGYRVRVTGNPDKGEDQLFFCRLSRVYSQSRAAAVASRLREVGLGPVIVVPAPSRVASTAAPSGVVSQPRAKPPPARADKPALPPAPGGTGIETGQIGQAPAPEPKLPEPPRPSIEARQIARVPAPTAMAPEPPPRPGELEKLSGRWCGDRVIFGRAGPQIWKLTGNRAKITVPAVAGATDRAPIALEGQAELLADRVKLVLDDPAGESETIYRIDGKMLRGVSYQRIIKASGMKQVSIPDDLSRCK